MIKNITGCKCVELGISSHTQLEVLVSNPLSGCYLHVKNKRRCSTLSGNIAVIRACNMIGQEHLSL